MASRTASTVEINGYALREIRVRSGVAVADLAEQLGVDRSYVTKMELGRSQRVSPKVYAEILTALSIADRRVLLANPHPGALVAAS